MQLLAPAPPYKVIPRQESHGPFTIISVQNACTQLVQLQKVALCSEVASGNQEIQSCIGERKRPKRAVSFKY